MNTYFISSEAFPFSKTGGLADMAYFLPKSLNTLGHHVKVVTPFYQQINAYKKDMIYVGSKTINVAKETWVFNYFKLIYEETTYYFVENMHFFERPNFYGYDDDFKRFIAFDYAVLELFSLIDDYPQILHINDWQTGMIPYLLDEHYRKINDHYFKIHTLLTIHNMQYQGSFDPKYYPYLSKYFDYTYIHFERINFLKAAIERSTKINTVSPSYKDEILKQSHGFTLDGSLENRSKDLFGILNGIDETLFNPTTDKNLTFNYHIKNAVSTKKKLKSEALNRFNLNHDVYVPLIVYIGRLADQKGISLILQSIEDCVAYSDANFILMGSGEKRYEDAIKQLTQRHPNRIAHYIGFNETLAHQLYAASDLFLMPSFFEPCGLGQMMAMKYGSLPIVHETGGLKDTVIPYNQYTGEGTGFSFQHASPNDLKDQIFIATDLYINHKFKFNALIRQAMRQDFSVDRMAIAYEALYKMILGE
jgi:starch synthase